MLKVHPDKFSDFLSRGEQYVLFMTNGVGIINTAMDVVRTKATEAFTNMGQLNTGKYPIYTPPPPPPAGWRPTAPASPSPDRSAEADAGGVDVGVAGRRGPEIIFPDVPMMVWRTQHRSHLASRPWSLQAPQHFQQAYDLGTPVAAWVTKAQQAWHSMHLMFLPGEVDGERVNILQAADRDDDLRTGMELYTIPPAAYYLAQCRELHDRQVSGPSITAGWSSFVAGESEFLSSRLLLLGASGSRIYTLGAKRTSRAVGEILKEYQSYHNMEAYQQIGSGPVEWSNRLRDYRHTHERELTYCPGPGRNPVNKQRGIKEHIMFESMTVIITDDHNGLCGKGSKYIGLNPHEAASESEKEQRQRVLREYCEFFTELTYFWRVIYCYSPCPERFQMDLRLRDDSTMLASMSKHFGCLPVNIEPFWLSIAPLTLPSRTDPRVKDPWHH